MLKLGLSPKYHNASLITLESASDRAYLCQINLYKEEDLEDLLPIEAQRKLKWQRTKTESVNCTSDDLYKDVLLIYDSFTFNDIVLLEEKVKQCWNQTNPQKLSNNNHFLGFIGFEEQGSYKEYEFVSASNNSHTNELLNDLFALLNRLELQKDIQSYFQQIQQFCLT